MRRQHRNRPVRTSILGAALIASPAVLGGCYTRTVESRGIGTRWQTGDTYQPNLKTTEEGGSLFDGAGDLLIGPRTIEQRRR